MGTVISIPSSGLIAANLGWEWVFYLHGGLSLIWCLLWVIFVSDTPQSHGFISEAERDYIVANAASAKAGKAPPVPWAKILRSRPVWTLIVCHMLNNAGYYMILVELPLFMRAGLGFNIKQVRRSLAPRFTVGKLTNFSNRRTRGYPPFPFWSTGCFPCSTATASTGPDRRGTSQP